MRLACLLGIGLAIGGCRTRPTGAAVVEGDAPDLALAACLRHTLEPAPLLRIEPQDAVPPTFSSTMRVRVTRALGGCDLPGQVDYRRQFGDATDWYELDAQRWVADRVCGPSREHAWVLAFSMTNVISIFRDRHSDVAITIEAMSDPHATCEPAGAGNACFNDCQCTAQEEAGCVRAGESGACLQTCNHRLACRDPERRACVEPGRPERSFCASSSPGGCADCPAPLQCNAGVCAPPPLTEEQACACQTDCAPGQLCNARTGLCVTPCTDDRACPLGAGCIQSVCHLLE